ncbi:hypothetical protein HGO97_009600 [Faecalicatena sp. AGMB00832]|uniref:SdpI/YhfL family protein n=1 Tax=Faecalicatena faecalis TaxID=2726362 RepID=A0ABS6D396_9FIRM|nr:MULTISPECIES: hypothetical protein [Faecalicatena]MBU3876064.1 hypothetical protein [Faecalicatena faecalis]MCI6463983.1 hypothetical protein [Faecalicatena sp.]MDY5618997.1 hypothetical protein [Lachnospiraceae bacterium]
MDSMFGAISILILCCGIYCLYAYLKMKKDGHINEVLLLGKNFSEHNCKDKKAYMEKAVPAVLIFGIVTTLYGAIDAIHFYVTPIQILDYIAMAVFFVALVWFMVYTTKLKNKYF